MNCQVAEKIDVAITHAIDTLVINTETIEIITDEVTTDPDTLVLVQAIEANILRAIDQVTKITNQVIEAIVIEMTEIVIVMTTSQAIERVQDMLITSH